MGQQGLRQMSGRHYLDTNLIIRFLVRDREAHARAAATLFESLDAGDVKLVILPSVLSECVYVMESIYKLPAGEIAQVLLKLVQSPGIELAERHIHLDALERYAVCNVDYVDCTLAAYAAASGCSVATFDTDFKRFADVKVFNPAKS
jgi:predicted nucleic acid-binding protein